MRYLKVARTILWALAIASAAALLWQQSRTPSANASMNVAEDGPLEAYFPTPEFELIDQNSEPFTSADLQGKPWVGFIFLTHCPTGACPMMVGKMGDLQDALPEGVEFVSFTVDPDRDTPEAMKNYVETITGDAPSDRWHLLTGLDREGMTTLAAKMGLAVADDFGHTTRFLLVDESGTVRGLYGNDDPDGMTKLAADAKKLMAE